VIEGIYSHPINKSGKIRVMVSVWDFGNMHPQKERWYYKCNDHPAKMRPALARAILQVYGESPVLDPMAGIGTTLVEAMLLGMDAIGVELENKFVRQANENIRHVRKIFKDRKLGNAVCIKADARNLSKILGRKKVRSIAFSPPYFDVIKPGKENPHEVDPKKLRKLRKLKPEEYRKIRSKAGYSSNKENIGNISKYGEIFGSIVFSPPYWNALENRKHKNLGSYSVRKRLQRIRQGYGKNQENLGNSKKYQTYLGEMLKVYGECYKVLKPGKFMVVVVKDIRRKGLTIPLASDTIKLCQQVGFKCYEIIINKMYFPSFWMVHHAIKAQEKGEPKALKTHEYVLVFKK